MPEKKQRLDWIDALKGFAIILVVLFHCLQGYHAAGMFNGQMDTLWRVSQFLGNLRMPVFFAISGYLFSYMDSNSSWKRLKYKVAGTTILYFVFSAAQIFVQILMRGSVNNAHSMRDLLYLPLKAVAPYWYLYVLIFCYLVSFALSRVRVSTLVTVSFIVSLASQHVGSVRIFELQRLGFYYFFFALGRYLYERPEILRKWRTLVWPLSAACVVMYARDLGEYLPKTLRALVVMSTCFLIFSNWKPASASRALRFCGRRSLPIYLLHVYFTSGTRIVLRALGCQNLLVYLLSGAALGVIAPILIYEFCSRNEVLSWIFNPAKLLQKVCPLEV